MFKRLIALSLLTGTSLLSTGCQAMGKLYLFSEVKGVVTQKGQPVSGAVLERSYHWHWKSQKGQDETRTDTQGRFSFPAITGGSLMASVLPHQPLIEQRILIKHQGQVFKAWVFSKGDYKDQGELEGKPIVLACDLDAEPTRKDRVFGICEIK